MPVSLGDAIGELLQVGCLAPFVKNLAADDRCDFLAPEGAVAVFAPTHSVALLNIRAEICPRARGGDE